MSIRSRRIAAAAFAAWGVLLFWLSSQSALPEPPGSFENRDKVEHALYFCAGAMALAVAAGVPTAWMTSKGPRRWSRGVAVVAVMVLVGLGDEFHQTFTPNRSGMDPGDLAADTIGATLGVWAVVLWCRRRGPGNGRLPSDADVA